jgi:hypothetical protein
VEDGTLDSSHEPGHAGDAIYLFYVRAGEGEAGSGWDARCEVGRVGTRSQAREHLVLDAVWRGIAALRRGGCQKVNGKGQLQWSADVSSLVWASAVHGSGFRPGCRGSDDVDVWAGRRPDGGSGMASLNTRVLQGKQTIDLGL